MDSFIIILIICVLALAIYVGNKYIQDYKNLTKPHLRSYDRINRAILKYLGVFDFTETVFTHAYRSSQNEWLIFVKDGLITNCCVDLGYFIYIPFICFNIYYLIILINFCFYSS